MKNFNEKNLSSEESNKDSESWFRYAIEATSDGLYDMDVITGTARCNSRYYNMLGYELYELPPSTETWLSQMHPEDKDFAYSKLNNQILKKCEYLEQEYRLKHKDGSWVWILDRSKIVEYDKAGKPLRIIGTHVDITERKQLENMLKVSEENYRTFINSTDDMAFIKDENFEYIMINLSYQKYFGKSEHEILGKTDFEIMTESGAINCLNSDKQALFRKGIFITIESIDDFFYETKKFPVMLHNGNIGVGGFIRDITKAKFAEEKIKKLLAEKELILREVHHRLKNNMNTLKGLLTLQAMSLKDPLAISALQDTLSRIDSMVVLYDKLYCSDNFKDISLLVYLPSLIDEIISNFPNSKSVKIEKKIDDFIVGLEILQPLGIIINELLTNIMKYAFNGRNDGLISVAATLEDKKVSIVISDNGNGIPESVNFENSEGFGMKLISILTEQIRGNIRIERNNGTKFILNFDL